MITFYGGSGQLYRSAKVSYEHISTDASDLDANQPEALSAIIMASASIEAFLNELAEMVIRDPEGAPWRPNGVNAYAERWAGIEKRKGSTIEKFKNACRFFSILPDSVIPLRQNVDDLFCVRNALMHFRPDEGKINESLIVIDNSKTYSRLRSKNVLPVQSSLIANWVTQIQNRTAARWACNTASESILRVISAIPGTMEMDEPSFKSTELRGADEAFIGVQ